MMTEGEIGYLETELELARRATTSALNLAGRSDQAAQAEVEVEKAMCMLERARTRIRSYRAGLCGARESYATFSRAMGWQACPGCYDHLAAAHCWRAADRLRVAIPISHARARCSHRYPRSAGRTNRQAHRCSRSHTPGPICHHPDRLDNRGPFAHAGHH